MIFDHVLFAARFPLFHFDERDVEIVGRVHVVRAVLVPQRPHPFRARPQRQIVQLELVALVPNPPNNRSEGKKKKTEEKPLWLSIA